MVSSTRPRIALAAASALSAVPVPNSNQPGDTFVVSAIACMSLTLGFVGSIVSSRCKPVLDKSKPFSDNASRNALGSSLACSRACRIRAEMEEPDEVTEHVSKESGVCISIRNTGTE